MKNIVITGALGHIGSKAIRSLPAQFPNAKFTLIDNLSTQRYASLFNLPDNTEFNFIEADVLKLDLSNIVKDSTVINLAAITDAAASAKNKEVVEHNNHNIICKLAEACVKTNSPIIHLSSTSVYGVQEGLVDENCADDQLKPQSPYAESKLKEERLLQSMRESERLNYVVFRFGTIAGVSPGMRFHTAVNKFCWQAVMGQPITVWRTALNQYRPYLSLDDAMGALAFALSNQLYEGETYNVLTNNLTVNDIVEGIKKYVPNLTIKYIDEEIMNQLSYQVATDKLVKKGFKYHGDLYKNIKDTIQWLKKAGGTRVII